MTPPAALQTINFLSADDFAIDDTNLTTNPLQHPYIRSRVNKDVEVWRRLDAKYGAIPRPSILSNIANVVNISFVICSKADLHPTLKAIQGGAS